MRRTLVFESRVSPRKLPRCFADISLSYKIRPSVNGCKCQLLLSFVRLPSPRASNPRTTMSRSHTISPAFVFMYPLPFTPSPSPQPPRHVTLIHSELFGGWGVGRDRRRGLGVRNYFPRLSNTASFPRINSSPTVYKVPGTISSTRLGSRGTQYLLNNQLLNYLLLINRNCCNH